jgi:hypothetical protein
VPTTSWREIIANDEDERFLRFAEQLRDLQKKKRATNADGVTLRGLHGKGHVGVDAELEVLANVPEHAHHGLFAEPKKYAAYARFSNGNGAVQHDRKGDVRGFAFKVLGVPGKKIIKGLEDATTQDFLLIQSSATPFRTPDEFVAFVRAAAGAPSAHVFKLARSVGIRRAVQILKRLAAGAPAMKVATLAGRSYFSALPILVGPYAVRYALTPLQATDVPLPSARKNERARSADYLRDDLVKRLQQGPLAWDMKLQFFENETRTPIEDASVDWDTKYVTVARLTLPQQDPTTAEGIAKTKLVESLSFDPWHALEAHRPLGAMMRARRHAYFASIQERGAAPEPQTPEPQAPEP